MKIEAEIWSIKDGKIEEIKHESTIFVVKRKQAVETDKKQKKIEDYDIDTTVKRRFPLEPQEKRPGKIIDVYGTNSIHKNVHYDVKQWLDQGLSKYEIGKKIHEIYKRNTLERSSQALASVYIRYLTR